MLVANDRDGEAQAVAKSARRTNDSPELADALQQALDGDYLPPAKE